MIYILSNINDYYKNNIYINNLISKNYFIKLKIFVYSNDIIVFINNTNTKSIKYIFTNINDYNNDTNIDNTVIDTKLINVKKIQIMIKNLKK